MFPRRKRLSREAFPTALSRGKRLSSAHFTAVFSKDTNGYAVVVPKKVARLSVTRHRIKRRALEALRQIPLVGQALPNALILFPKESTLHLNTLHLREELVELLSKNH